MNAAIRYRWATLLLMALIALPAGIIAQDSPKAQPKTKPSPATPKSSPSEPKSESKSKSDAGEKSSPKSEPKATPKDTAKDAPKSAPAKPPVAIDWTPAVAWRSIGPANMSGRITALAVVESNPSTYYVASASGGLLKTTNNGTSYSFHFDKQSTVSIGDVAVAPSNPDIVWVGTGEANPRNSVSYGDGVYKSTDGAKSFQRMGLEKTYQTGKILIHPKNPDVVLVGSIGRLYGPNKERGVYRTTDGGKSWEQTLFVNERTGVIDMVMNPEDPNTILAATWEHMRDEFDSYVGPPAPDGIEEYGPAITYGPGSGIWKSTDGGKTWNKLTKGLPTVNMGRIGLTYSPKNPKQVFAIISTEKFGTGPAQRPSRLLLGVRTEEDDKGLKIVEVTANGPADKAGIKADDILTSLDKQPTMSNLELADIISKHKEGDVVPAVILRDGKSQTLPVKLLPATAPPAGGPRGGQGGGQGAGAARDRVQLGIYGEDVTDGIRIEEIVSDSPAQQAKLAINDVILTIDDAPANMRALSRVLFEKSVGDTVKLKIQRGDKKLDVPVKLAKAPDTQAGRIPRPYASTLSGQRENVPDRLQGADAFQTGGIYRSDDGGTTWTRINSLNPRPMYFSVLRVDPNDDQTIYVLGVNLYRSTNGGRTFRAYGNSGVHADHHALWIDPKNSKHLRLGTDGGLYVTYDQGQVWDHHTHMGSICQFYHVDVDDRKPYMVYGGLQDNGSWGGPSRTISAMGPTNADWGTIRGGDGFVCRVDRIEPDVVYSESQNGRIGRRNLKTGEAASISIGNEATSRYRWNWNTPFILSPSNPRVISIGAQYVFRSTNRGDRWKRISPELTRTNRGSMTALAESPLNSEVMWAGTDDGFVWITRDNGQTWTNVTAKIPLPGPRWVATIEASRYAPGRAYVTFDAHRSNDDQPYLFVTEDFGATWKPLHSKLPVGSTRVLREDIRNPDLLYVGTEFAVYASIDRGENWVKLNTNLPTVAVHEFAQPTSAEELVAATHGRGIWIADISVLRQMKAANLQAASKLYAPAAATMWRVPAIKGSGRSPSNRIFEGQNPERGTILAYSLTQPAEKVTLAIVDASGRRVREFKTETKPGMHIVRWDMLGAGAPQGRGGRVFLQSLAAGTYRVTLTVDGVEQTQPVVLEADPTIPEFKLLSQDSNADAMEDSDEEEEEERGGGAVDH